MFPIVLLDGTQINSEAELVRAWKDGQIEADCNSEAYLYIVENGLDRDQ